MKNDPTFNLPFKHIEKMVLRCIEEHLEHNNLYDTYQSAYFRGQLTETALLKVPSDIARALNEEMGCLRRIGVPP